MPKVVCITGVAGGIGSATAEIFAQNGWHVVGVDCIDPNPAASPCNRYVRADIGNSGEVLNVLDDITRREQRLDVLINNAAVQINKRLVDTEPDEWDSLMAVNVRGIYLLIKHAFPLLRMQGGSIVNVSSVHAIATSENIAAYATSKGALIALTRAAALELAPYNIRVNAVLPGAIDTDMLRAGLIRNHEKQNSIESRLESLSKRHAVGRIGRRDEVGEVIFFLSNDRGSSFITGQSIVVDGGAIARLSTE